MTNREATQKIGERHPPLRDWQDGLVWRAEPDGTVFVLVIPMIGFALAIMLLFSFAVALHGAAPGIPMPGIPMQGHQLKAAPPATAGRMAVFVL